MIRRHALSIFNRGIISRHALARSDVDRVEVSAEIQTNWMPRVLGSMMIRPGLEMIAETLDSAQSYTLPFVYGSTDYAGLELTPGVLRILSDGTTPLEREAGFSTTLTNGTFDSDLAGWTDADDGGAASTWATGGYMQLLGVSGGAARRRQAVTVATADQGLVHSLRITVERGEVGLRIGTSAGDDDVFTQAALRTGFHSIAFTPNAGTIYIEFFSTLTYPTLLDSVAFEAAGVVELPTVWSDTASCASVRWSQINDVVFCAADGVRQQRIERRANDSWSVVDYEPSDGPFPATVDEDASLTPSAVSGEITVTASQPLFSESDVGVLYRMVSAGQLVEADISAEDVWTDYIRVIGVGAVGRRFTISIAGTWSGTVTLQRSVGAPGAWADVFTYTSNSVTTLADGLDNQEIYYRIGVAAGDYSSGTMELSLEYSSGSITGVVRVIGFTSTTEVDAIVLSNLGGTEATKVWAKSQWGGASGFPTSVAFSDGRLCWTGRGRFAASVSDAFDSFDPDYEGDAGPINRTIGNMGTHRASWMLPLDRLIVGTDGGEHAVRSSSLDEPVTASNYNVRKVSTQGSAPVPAVEYDRRGLFVQRSGVRLYELAADGVDYTATDMTALVPEIGEPGIARLAVQRQPDTRIHCVLGDGTVAILVRDPVEDVLGWVKFETDGVVEDAFVLPGEDEDQVFYTVRRTINGATKRFHERWARESECRGGAMSKVADCFLAVTRGAASDVVTGLDHLEGEEVVIWGDGADLGTATVSSGSITLPSAAAAVCVGLGYTARYQSTKIAPVTKEFGSMMSRRGRVVAAALILADTHAQGLEVGGDFITMDNLPLTEDRAPVGEDFIWAAYAEEPIEVPGDMTNDVRFCMRATAPRPVTVLGALVDVDWQG